MTRGMMTPMADTTGTHTISHEDIEVGDVITVESPDRQWAIRARVIGIDRWGTGSLFTLHGPLELISVGHPDGDFIITDRRPA